MKKPKGIEKQRCGICGGEITVIGLGKKTLDEEVKAFFELDRHGKPTGVVFIKAKRERDIADLQRRSFRVLRGKKITFIYEKGNK